MKHKKIFILCMTLLIALSLCAALTGCGDDKKNEPSFKEVTLTTTNYATYLGVRVASISNSVTPGNKYSTDYTYTLEIYSMKSGYEFVNVKLTLRGKEIALTTPGLAASPARKPLVPNIIGLQV